MSVAGRRKSGCAVLDAPAVLIDTHCHLDAEEFSGDRDAVVQAAFAAGVSAIVVPAVAPANFPAVRQCCERYAGCYPAYGIHPLYLDVLDACDGSVFRQLRDRLQQEQAGPYPPAAVGEIGLDFFVPEANRERQEFFFVEQLKIARDFDLPVLLHVRRSVDQVLKCLRRVGVRRGIAHAFNGSLQQADEFLRLGFKLGFGGAMTFTRATRIRQLAMTLPLDAIVLETDAPDIPPAWLGGARNAPQELLRIAGVLAELRNLSRAEVEETTSRNAKFLLESGQACGFA